MQFYDREKETALIRDLIRKDHCFLVITGRRRIGKTRLVREALKDEDHLDLFIPRKRMTLALDQLSKMLREQTGYSPTFVDFREFLEYLLRMEDRIIFLDEISNLEHMDKGAFSDIQEMIDRYSAERRIRLIVDGSYAGIMRRIFEDSKEPLFGRATNMLRLQPLPLYYSIKMLMDNGIGFGDAIEMYSLFGGVPRYLELLRAYKDMDELIRNVFSPGSIFLYEGENVLIQEFGSSWDTYFSILEVISRGKFGP
ncbi:MAG: ATP-binding protein, partial [Candidatus Thermoplasmatota archaeon]|nr:ATP-binding protein [Candidatus Thermoplasmatota archaeon]